VSTPTPTPAQRGETERAERAEDVEAARVERAEDVEVTRQELADILEENRKQHNARVKQEIDGRTRQTNRRFLFLFAAICLIFGLLAYRTEVTSAALAEQQQATEQAFYDACLARQERQVQANVGRETMVQLAINGPNAPGDAAGKVLLTQQLRDALLLPVEDCGESPAP
jgi:hypothetical protein